MEVTTLVALLTALKCLYFERWNLNSDCFLASICTYQKLNIMKPLLERSSPLSPVCESPSGGPPPHLWVPGGKSYACPQFLPFALPSFLSLWVSVCVFWKLDPLSIHHLFCSHATAPLPPVVMGDSFRNHLLIPPRVCFKKRIDIWEGKVVHEGWNFESKWWLSFWA